MDIDAYKIKIIATILDLVTIVTNTHISTFVNICIYMWVHGN